VLLSISAGVVGLVSYACTLYLAHALPAADYTQFTGALMIVGIVGIVAGALVPLPLADIVGRHPRGSADRRAGMAFAVPVSLAVGLLSAAVAGGLVATFAPLPVVLATAASALVLVAVAPTQGWLQGERRFGRYAAVSVLEVSVRLAFSVGATALGWGAAGAVLGFAAGGLVLCCVPAALLRDLAWAPAVLGERARWSETGDVALTRLVVATLVGADVVLVALLGDGSIAAAGYAALATLTKAPVYVAAGTVLVVFPLLRAGGSQATEALRVALQSFNRLALAAAAILTTVPPTIVLVVLPQRYADSLPLLPWLAAAGLGYAASTVLTTVLLAARWHRRCRYALGSATLIMSGGLGAGWALGATTGLAVGSAVAALLATAVITAIAAPALPGGTLRSSARALAAAALLGAVLSQARAVPTLWIALVVVVGLLSLRGGPPPRPGRATRPAAAIDADRPLRILHLGFEDPAMPGAGGGSARTHEINRRIVGRDDVTVLVARFPGCVDRVQDGVRYRHVGFGAGRNRLTRTAGYAAASVLAARRLPADLVVEDFFAPISTMGAPLWTRRPTIGVVQWLNARDKARQYRIPFHLVERFGVRRHRRLIAVSGGVAERLHTLNPRLAVHVIGNGVRPEAFAAAPRLGADILFVGRLEIAQKGVDLLLRAWARITATVVGQLVIAGTGPDEDRLRTLATGLGVADRVRFVGWVGGAEKFELIAASRVVAVPSRFETFGIVAIEALATGTPVVAFDIPCLRDVVPAGCGALVPAFDVTAYGAALAEYCRDPQLALGGGPRARAFAARYDWDALAAEQQRVYRIAVGDRCGQGSGVP
jgi:glycosyltransferase involved in cell wall biosynthesis/O-antigen/teichoic acid export membrane protein